MSLTVDWDVELQTKPKLYCSYLIAYNKLPIRVKHCKNRFGTEKKYNWGKGAIRFSLKKDCLFPSGIKVPSEQSNKKLNQTSDMMAIIDTQKEQFSTSEFQCLTECLLQSLHSIQYMVWDLFLNQ